MSHADTIVNLDRKVAALSDTERQRFDRMYRVSTVTGEMRVPEAMVRWVEQRFGTLEAVEKQRIVKITNLATLEGGLFNELRSARPFDVRESESVEQVIRESLGDPFCSPLTGTPEDPFGRVQGDYCITASNVAKYDGFHGLVVFDEHDPLIWDEAQIVDYLETARQWADACHETDPAAQYYFLMWNCLWKSGASIVHGHAQMTVSHDIHYAKVEGWRRAALAYKAEHGTNYFEDLWQNAEALGLAWRDGEVRGLASLTPVKEKEVLLIADSLGPELYSAIYHALDAFVSRMGVQSFNLALYVPPLWGSEESWEGIPVVARLVDRGDVNNRVADFGAMELFASSVVSSDPFAVARVMREERTELRAIA